MATKKTNGKKKRRYGWRKAEDEHLKKLHNKGLRVAAIRRLFNKKFNAGRSKAGVEKRLGELGLGFRERPRTMPPKKPQQKPPVAMVNGQHEEMSLNLGDKGTLTVILEGKLSRDGALRDKAAKLISDAAASSK